MADEQKFFEVTIPNTNVTIKFPEGTDPATIDQVMRQAHEQAMPKRDEAGMADRIKGMSRQQMVDTYRSLPKDDPLVGYLAERIAKPQQGETPQQAQERAYGKISDSTDKMGSTGGAAATFRCRSRRPWQRSAAPEQRWRTTARWSWRVTPSAWGT